MMYESIVLFSYFLFLFGLLYASRNITQIAEHPASIEAMKRVAYNLRAIPRVDYRESSSDEEMSQEEVASPMDIDSPSETPSDTELRQRRDRNPVGRMLEASD